MKKPKNFLVPTKEKLKKTVIFWAGILLYKLLNLARKMIISRRYVPEEAHLFSQNFGWIFAIIYYVFIYFLMCFIYKDKKQKFKEWIKPNIVKLSGFAFYVLAAMFCSRVFLQILGITNILYNIWPTLLLWFLEFIIKIIIIYLTICILNYNSKSKKK